MKRIVIVLAAIFALSVAAATVKNPRSFANVVASRQAEIVFTTEAEIAEYFKRVFGIETVVFDPAKYDEELVEMWGSKIEDPAELVEKASRIAKEMIRIQARFPGLKFNHIDVLFITSNNIGIASVPAKGATSVWMSVMDELDILEKSMWEDYLRQNGFRWNTARPGDVVEAVFRHEYAHTITSTEAYFRFITARLAVINGMRQPGDSVFEAVSRYGSWLRSTVSMYATTDVIEEIAEMFSMYTSGTYIVGTFPEEIEAVLEFMVSGEG